MTWKFGEITLTGISKIGGVNLINIAKIDEISRGVVTLPIVTTNIVTDVTYNTAIGHGSIDEGTATVSEHGIVIAITANPTLVTGTKFISTEPLTSFSANLTGLTDNQLYYARAYCISDWGIAYGSDTTFTTLDLISMTLSATPVQVLSETYSNGWAVPDQENQRIVIDPFVVTGNLIRIQVGAPVEGDLVLLGASIGVRSGETPDFSASPTRLTFSGANSITIAAGTAAWSDWTVFDVQTSIDYLINLYMGAGWYPWKNGTYLSYSNHAVIDMTMTLPFPATWQGAEMRSITAIEIKESNLYVGSVSAEPGIVYINGVPGIEETSVANLNAQGEWFWDGTTLTVYSTTTPIVSIWYAGEITVGDYVLINATDKVLINATDYWVITAESGTPVETVIDQYTDISSVLYYPMHEDTADVQAFGQIFTGSGLEANGCRFYTKKLGTPPGNLVAKIYAISGDIPTGSTLATSDTVAATSLSTSPGWIEFTFSTPYTPTNGVQYGIVLDYTDWVGSDASNCVYNSYFVGIDDGNYFERPPSPDPWQSFIYYDAPFQVFNEV